MLLCRFHYFPLSLSRCKYKWAGKITLVRKGRWDGRGCSKNMAEARAPFRSHCVRNPLSSRRSRDRRLADEAPVTNRLISHPVKIHTLKRHRLRDVTRAAASQTFSPSSSGVFLLQPARTFTGVCVCVCVSRNTKHRHARPALTELTDQLTVLHQSRTWIGSIYQDTIIWLMCYYFHSSLLFAHLWSLQ